MSKQFNNEELKEHFAKVDKLIKYYIENMDRERGTVEEALSYLFADLSTEDLNRAFEDVELKENNKYWG